MSLKASYTLCMALSGVTAAATEAAVREISCVFLWFRMLLLSRFMLTMCKDPKRDLAVDLIRRIGNELYYSATIWWVVVGDDSMTQGVEVSK